MAWQLQDAKAKFSELVQKALDEGPQTATRHGKETVVVLSVKDYARLRAREPALKQVLMSVPRAISISKARRTMGVRSSFELSGRHECFL